MRSSNLNIALQTKEKQRLLPLLFLLCSPGRIRTYDQSITLLSIITDGVDYIIAVLLAAAKCLGVRRFVLFFTELLPRGIVSEPSRHAFMPSLAADYPSLSIRTSSNSPYVRPDFRTGSCVGL